MPRAKKAAAAAAEDKTKAPPAAAPPAPPTPMAPQPAMMAAPGPVPTPPPVALAQGHPQVYQPQQLHQPMVPMGAGPSGQLRVVDRDSFLRVRDSAVQRLHAMAELVRSLTNDYIVQTNALLGESTPEGAHLDILANFDPAAAQIVMPMPEMMAPTAVAAPVEEKKERKKRTIDPLAPKRPLTPYFLYMQNARQIIATDLGPSAPKGAVQEEGQRRWAHMEPANKHEWNRAYQWNLRLYNARVHSYKGGNVAAKDMIDDDAREYADANGIPNPEEKEEPVQVELVANDNDAIAEQLQQVADAPDSPEPAEETKTPKKTGGGRKRKTATPGGEVLAPSSTPAPAPASPDKKRRRVSGKVPDTPVAEEPKKSGRKKTKNA